MAIRVPTQSAQKPISAYPLPYRLYMKFDHKWPDFRDIHFFKNLNRPRTTDHQYTNYLEPFVQVS